MKISIETFQKILISIGSGPLDVLIRGHSLVWVYFQLIAMQYIALARQAWMDISRYIGDIRQSQFQVQTVFFVGSMGFCPLNHERGNLRSILVIHILMSCSTLLSFQWCSIVAESKSERIVTKQPSYS